MWYSFYSRKTDLKLISDGVCKGSPSVIAVYGFYKIVVN